MVDKNVFTQELKKVFTILKEIKLVEKYVKELIDNNNLTEDKVTEFEEQLNQYKRDLDYINENTELLQESLNQMNINLEDLIEYIDSIKDFINQNENTTEVGGNLEVDGTLQVNSNISTEDMSISGELTLPSTSNLIFEDGSTFGGGGSGKYLHEIKMYRKNYESYCIFFYIISDRETQYTDIKDISAYIYDNYGTYGKTPISGSIQSNRYSYRIFLETQYNSYFRIVSLKYGNVTLTIDDVDYTVSKIEEVSEYYEKANLEFTDRVIPL